MNKGFVYILQSEKSGGYYVGSTDNVVRRFSEHQNGIVKSTRNLRPWVLKYSKEYESLTEARKVEYKLKSFKSRRVIEQIIGEKNIRVIVT